MLPKLFVGPWSFLRVSSHGGARLAAVASLVGGGVVAVLAPRVIRTPDGGGSRGTGAPVMVAGDTQVVYGPHVFSTPNGRPTNYVEALSLVVQPTRRYTLRLVNGAADGTQRATSGSLSLNGKLLFQGPDFSSGATLTRVVEPLSADTLLVTVEGPAGAFVTVSILADPDPTFTVYAERFTRTGGPTVTDTRSFALPAGAAPPYYVHLVNGNANGTSRMADGSIVVNGQTVATFDNHVGSVAVPVALQAQNTFQVLARAQGSSSGFLDVRFAATDTTHPAITITSPAPGLITRDTLVTVAGSVQDQTATSVAVNGQAASMTGNAFSLSARLATEGQNALHIVATDAAGHSTDSVRTVIRDTQQPVLTVTNPANNAVTKQANITVSGTVTDQTAVTVNANGVPLPVDGAGQFTGQVPLAEGPSFVTVTATDAAGNAATVVRSVTRDTQAPVLTVTAPVDGVTINADHVTVTGSVTDASAVTVMANGTSLPVAPDHSFSGDVALTDGPNTIAVVATDAAGNTTTISRSVTRQSQNLPPDPATVATPIDRTVATTVFASTAFLYSGNNPIQTGVAAGTIDQLRAAVVRGRTLARDGSSLTGVAVSILGRPEFGQTLSRADGRYDLAVNGGGQLTVALSKSGFLSAQRPVVVPWQDYVEVDDVVMIPLDGAVTAVDFASPTEVARGSVVTDPDGTRQGTLMFKQGTQATMVLPDGSQQPLSSLHVRVTEYTVGPNGLRTMPAPLPPASAYTYAAEFTADEATAAGATDLRFSQDVPFYLQNFLGFPVGLSVPMASYDRARGAWIPSRNGRVVQIVSVTGGLADLDITGDGVADDATPLGVDDAERQRLALLHSPGQSLWRIPVSHFSPWDANFPQALPDGAKAPDSDPARGGGGGGGGTPGDEENESKDKDDPSCQGGSVVECENQTLGERIRVTGTTFTLNYRSDRVPGRVASRELVIPLIGDTVPSGLDRIKLDVRFAGRVFEDSFPPTPNQQTRFVWDGNDAYGRALLGVHPVTIRIGYVYRGVYREPATGDTSFGAPGGSPLPGVDTRLENTLSRIQVTTLGTWDARAQGLGGWTLDIHHAYDPFGGVLYLGDGSRRSALTLGTTISTVAGSDASGFAGDGGPATRAALHNPFTVLAAPDGSFYIGDTFGARVRKVGTDGVISTVAGTGQYASGPDGGLAVQTAVNLPLGLALGPDGALYIAEWNASKIRRVGLDGIITTIAGTGEFGFSGDGGPAVQAALNAPNGLAFGPDGSLYVGDAQNNRIRRIGPDGIITTVAGTGVAGYGGDGGLAVEAMLNAPSGVAVSAQGDVYIADLFNRRVRRVSAEGIITTVAGNGTNGFTGDGGPATLATLHFPRWVSLDAGGVVYIADNPRVRVATPDGTIRTLIGNGIPRAAGDGGPPLAASVDAGGISLGANRVVYIADVGSNRIRAVRATLPGLGVREMLVASADGGQFYRFDPEGRHLSTIDALTGSVMYRFSYSADGLLTGVTDADSNVTTVERRAEGVPAAITSPFGRRTTLSLDAAGYLDRVTDPAGQAVGLHYTTSGLLDTLTTPRGHLHRFSYDSLGRLTRDQGPTGEDLTLERRELATATEVELKTAEGRSTVYHLEPLSTGELLRKTTDPAGLVSQVLVARSDSSVSTVPNGTVTTISVGPDPRSGMVAATLRKVTTRTPGGLTMMLTGRRVTTRPDSTNPLSLTSQLDSVSLNDQWTVTSYTAATRRLVQTSPEGRQVMSMLDGKGRVVSTRLGDLDSVTSVYDSSGRLAERHAGGRVTSYGYDPATGHLSTVTDALGRLTQFKYDSVGRLKLQTLADGRAIQFEYDAVGNVTRLTPPERPAHGFQYTPADLVQQYDPPGVPGPTPTAYFYSRDHQLDSIVRPDSIRILLGYDTAGRPSTIHFDRGILSYSYSRTTGNLATISAPSGDTVAFSYDGALPTAVRWAGTVNGSVEVGYRNDFRIVSQTVNGVDAVSFAFDRDGLLTRAGGLTLSRNATNGLLVADTLGSIASAYRHTSRGELESSRVTGKETTFLARTYARDSTGRISQLDDTTLGTATHWSFVYDSIGRLVADSVNGAPFHAFTYDANGNRLSYTSQSGTVAYSYDAQDRLLSAGSATYTYRSNGELQTKSISGAGTTTYTYDALGNLVTVVLPSGTRIDYVIDGQNRRVGRKVNGVLVKGWLYQNQLNPVAELDGSGNIVSRFVYGSRMNVPAYMERNGVVYRIISDQLGSVRLVVDTATNTITQRIDYDEWGNIILNTNPGFQSFGFAGGILDDSTTLVRFGFRDYDASTGRWTAKDLIGFAGSETDLYAYALNSPLNAIDPQGLQVVCEWEQWSGHLTCDNWTTGEDGVIDTYGYAGKDYGWNNPFAQDVKNTGPIPEGLYDIGAPDWGTQGLGNPAFRLTPWPGNEMFGRGDFWLHADNPKTLGQSSKGCPIVGLGARKTLADELKKAGGIGILDVLQGPWSR